LKNILLLLLLFSTGIYGQSVVHSHNDYEQKAPFYQAFSAGCQSIEADVFLQNGKLLVAHNKEDLDPKNTLEQLYLEPIISYSKKISAIGEPLYLFIDCKTEAIVTLTEIVKSVESKRQILELVKNQKLKIIISGNRPSPEHYTDYPDFILFDHQDISEAPLNIEKVGTISLPFYRYSRWNGKGRLSSYDSLRVSNAIHFAHSVGKKIRFWATPDNPTSWFTLVKMGVDFINTDKPFECNAYLKNLGSSMALYKTNSSNDVNNYPTINRKGVFIVIGDGCGLAQWSAAMISHGPLNIERIKHIGLSKTQSSDDFTTDSAAGGTAIATGKKTRNRYIGKDPDGKPLKSLMELDITSGRFKGIITTDNVAGATPASFYAHVEDRDSTYKITSAINQSDLDVIIGNADEEQKKIISKSFLCKNPDEAAPSLKREKTAILYDKIPFVTEERGNYLEKNTKLILDEISISNRDFIVMIENGHIDGAGHANKSTELMNEVLDLDHSVGILMDFIDNNPQCTLIVTADHETGGVTLPHADAKGNPEIRFQSDDHTGIPVPVFAYGAGAHLFQGIYPNTAIFSKILELLKK